MNVLNVLRRGIDRNAYYCRKEIEPTKRIQLEVQNSFAEPKTELKEIHRKLDNAEEQTCDQKDRIIGIT